MGRNRTLARLHVLLTIFFVFSADRIVALDPTSQSSQYRCSVCRVQDGHFGKMIILLRGAANRFPTADTFIPLLQLIAASNPGPPSERLGLSPGRLPEPLGVLEGPIEVMAGFVEFILS